ncbi:MAG: hypothetical protein ACRD2O_10995 [Terriglobia bacterium]
MVEQLRLDLHAAHSQGLALGCPSTQASGGRLLIAYAQQDGVLRVHRVTLDGSELDWVRSRLKTPCPTGETCPDDDALMRLIGQSESAIVALLGPPGKRGPLDGDAYSLYWSFPMAGYPAGDANVASNQTLALGFKAGSGCSSVTVTW